MNVLLEGASKSELDWARYFQLRDEGAIIPPAAYPPRRLPALRWGVRFLEATVNRPPLFHCFGLHEWAMVYRAKEVRHSKVPLRVTESELARFVEEQNLCCTHFDAFRFFTPEAVPLNRIQLNRYSTMEFEQAGCIHANMDLYKWAFLAAPFVSSQLIADAFDLAWQAREIDMRASPYDLQDLGFEPIAIETKAGREEYVSHQRKLYELSRPLRQRLLAAYTDLEQTISSYVGTMGTFSNGTNSWSPQDSSASTGSK